MALSLDGFKDVDFGDVGGRRNKTMIRYNDSTGKFDLVYIDATLGIITDSPNAFNQRVVEEIKINNITNNTIDGGVF